MANQVPEVMVYIPTSLRSFTGGLARVRVLAATVGEVIDALERSYPGIRDRLCEDGALRHYVNVYVNGEEVRSLQGEQTPVKSGDEVAFVPMLMGGSRGGIHYLREHDVRATWRSGSPENKWR